ncbi:MAG: DUF6880 family protein [Betaproteobacteria bacterium]
MARKMVNRENLEGLGIRRLAEILLELGEEDAEIKRRLRLELASEAGADVVAADIAKCLVTLRRARSFIEWPKRRSFVKDIDRQREMITTKVAETRPDLALDLMWRFMELAEPTLNRIDDSHGDVSDVFRQACRDLGAIAVRASPDPIRLADRVFDAVTTNDYGEYDQVVRSVFPALKEAGTARLKSRLSTALAEQPESNDRYDFKAAALKRALQDIADGEGDVDAYMAQESATSGKSPRVAAEIANRLLAAGRAQEAHAVLKEGSPMPGGYSVIDWEQAWVEVLLATDRGDEAQDFRWHCFEHRLDASHLRDYLKGLPDFEDVLAEEKALDHALTFPHFTTALAFLIEWKEQRYAARLVLECSAEIDGNAYCILDPAAKTLESAHPLAATLLRRAMIEDTLKGVKSKRYRHAARHILECHALDPIMEDYAAFENHDAFVERIRANHGRKTGFWSRVAERTG